MLESLFPRAHARYSSLPVVGGSLASFCDWLDARGYPRNAIRQRVWAARWLEDQLRRNGVRTLGELTAATLRSYAPVRPRAGSRPRGALVRSLAGFLDARGELAPTLPTRTERCVADYCRHLERVRGLCSSTVAMHTGTVKEFLRFLDHDKRPEGLRELRIADVDTFVAKVAQRVGRGRMSNVTATLRSFLRFLAARGEGPAGLDAQVESPRLWRGGRLPRALTWEQVRVFLCSIDRETPKGRRDYAIFLLIATYGLRTGEVRALGLDDLVWRSRQIHLPRPKVGVPLHLPLTDEVGTAIIDYLQRDRPVVTCRHLFLRVESPLGPLGPHVIGHAFRAWARRAGISVPDRGGPHSLRHALAMRLLREGATLKTIGDLLGHRSAEATGVYLRLDSDDLRDVALPLPTAAATEEVPS